VTLIQLVLTLIPIYFFFLFRVPKSVADKLVRLQRRFLWGGGPDQNKIAWVRWETVCLPKKMVVWALRTSTTLTLHCSENGGGISCNTKENYGLE